MNNDAGQRSQEGRTNAAGVPWSEVKTLFEAAVELDGEARKRYLDAHCGHNTELRAELADLLESHDLTSGFLEEPVVSLQSLIDETLFSSDGLEEVETPDAQIGTRIGPYRLEKVIGRGGMGEVYLATRADSEFDQQVAIKLIRNGSENALAVKRFRQERQILARLENPYIARLLDGGSTPTGLPYFVMEFVEGQPVNRYCDNNNLTVRERLGLFLKVCSAVQYAHGLNIVHRDLKPGNILVKSDGTPKLLDFGIAKILDLDQAGSPADATQHSFRVLTPAYASPEQLRGFSATVKSDIYSLGLVLYELICGERPKKAHFHVGDAQLRNAPADGLSTELRAIVMQAIQTDPDERYETVENFSTDVRRYLSGAPLSVQTDDTENVSVRRVRLAILPFRIVGDRSTATAFLSPGITTALITKLSRIERLSIPPTSAVLKYADGIEALRAARELRVEYVLEGSLHVSGEQLRANFQLVFAEAGIAVFGGQVDATETTLLELEDSVAEQVAHAVLSHLTGEERAQISRAETGSGAAHAAYLRGRWHWNNAAGDAEKLLKALLCFTQAKELDPAFARAYAGIADYHLRMGLWGGIPPSECFAAAIEAAQTAVKLEPSLGEAHASLAFALWAFNRDEEAAERHFTLATVRNPNYATAHHWFGLLNSARNQPELAIANLERARAVDPNSALIAAALGFVHYNARQFTTALEQLLEAARELPKSAIVQEMLAWCYLQTGALKEARESGTRAVQMGNRGSAALSALAHAEAALGNLSKAADLREEIERAATKMYVSSYDRATAALAVGDRGTALRLLEQARTERDWWLCWIGVDPRWDVLRHESRFRRLLEKKQQPAGIERTKYKYVPAVLLALVLLAFGLRWWTSTPRTAEPFVNVQVTKLTSNGTAESAVLSPDGETVVFTAHNADGQVSVWRRDVRTRRAAKLVDSLTGKVANLQFTDGDAAVAFVNYPLRDPAHRSLWKVPVAGGRVVAIGSEFFKGPVSLSPDGRQLAYYVANPDSSADELVIGDVASPSRRVVVSLAYPLRFAWNSQPAWSPDRSKIAYAAEERDQRGFLIRLYIVNVANGSRKVVPSPRWQWVDRIAWPKNGAALAVVGQEHESSFQQIWYLPLNGSSEHSRRISSDLNDYFGVSVAGSAAELVSVQSQTLSNIYLAKSNDPTNARQITAGSGRYFDLCWTPQNQILYASDATGSADLWTMNPDGTGEHPVVAGLARNYAPAFSPRSNAMAFHSNRSGNWQIWRADPDGSKPVQLSNSAGDGNWPQFTPDGSAILFHRTSSSGVFHLWRIPTAGGQAKQITTRLTMHPAVSPVDGKIAAWYSANPEAPQWKLAVFAPDGGEPLRILNPTPGAKPDTPIRWTPKGDAIAFLEYQRSASNIWLLPVDGRPARPLTTFDSGEIYSFDWSSNGGLVFSRGLTTSDVVLIKDLNAAGKGK